MSRRSMEERWKDDDRIYLGLYIKRRILPTIIGGVVGDALGVPVEFRPRDMNVKDMTGFGTYNQPPGTWSDDTSLTLCLMENLIEEKDEYHLMEKFVDYRDKGNWTPYGHMFDIGRTTYDAIQRFKDGAPVEQWGGASEYDNGNGALMRIAPLVFVLAEDFNFNNRLIEIEKYAHLTHRHPLSTLGCIFYTEFLIRLYHNNSLEESYKDAVDLCIDNLTGTIYENEFSAYDRIFKHELLTLDREQIASDGYVVHSLEAALWCFAKHDNYRDTVLEAVNLGGDTDTIAFLAGTMAGMRYKMDDIPQDWIDQLARKADLIELCYEFGNHCRDVEYSKRENS